MNLCSDGHDEVCFEGKHCPVCVTRDDLQKQLTGSENECSDLKDVLTDLRAEVNSLRAENLELSGQQIDK